MIQLDKLFFHFVCFIVYWTTPTFLSDAWELVKSYYFTSAGHRREGKISKYYNELNQSLNGIHVFSLLSLSRFFKLSFWSVLFELFLSESKSCHLDVSAFVFEFKFSQDPVKYNVIIILFSFGQFFSTPCSYHS